MKNIVIAGSSGLGKTFLEEELEKKNISFQLPKYFDRENRPGERKDKNISVDKNEWKETEKEFFFKLEYNGGNYGWKKRDIRKNKPVSLAITLKDLKPFLKENKNFVPILLWMSKENFYILEKRMIKRGENQEKIRERLKLASEELIKMEEYKKLVKIYGGKVFEIKNDKTIFEEVIPEIMTLE